MRVTGDDRTKAKKNTKSRYWVDDNSILPEIVITPQGNYPVLDEAGNPARTVGAIQDINPNAHIYERVNTQPFMDDYIEGETNTAANQRADALDAQVVPHMGDFVSAAAKPLDALMPSRWVGLLDKDYDGLSAVDRFSRLFDENNRGLFINDNPYGLFSKRYAEEHPYWTMAGNTAFDVASTPFIWNGANKAYNAGKTAYNTGRNAVRNYNFAKALDADIANTNLSIGEPTGGIVRRKLGDVEINNPNLFYRLDGGDHQGAFSKQGAYIKDSLLYPGPPKRSNDVGYTWWSKGSPYTYSEKEPWTPYRDINEGNIPSSRLIVTSEGETPSLLHVKSQNYQIGQWNGKKGLVGIREYVTPEPVKVSDNVYTWEPGYGYKKVTQEPSTISWRDDAKDNIGFASLDTEINSKLPAALKAVKAMKKADADVAKMSEYHAKNVEAYNEATGSDIIAKPFRTDYSTREIKVLPKEEFNETVGRIKTNSPSADIENIGGLYHKRMDTVFLRNNGTPSNAYHEFLHSNYYGVTNPEVTKWRIRQLVDSQTEAKMSPTSKAYFLSESEFPVHLRQQGELMGINVGDPFPGEEAFDSLLHKYPARGASYYTKGVQEGASLEDKKLLWKALNGTLFGGIGAIAGTAYGVSNQGNNQLIQVQKFGGRILPPWHK